MGDIENLKQIPENNNGKDTAFNKLVRRIAPHDVYWCNLGDVHEQINKYMIKKVRPCIILSDDSDDMRKDVFTCLPIKSFKGDYENMYFITKKIELGDVESLVCLDQIRPINRRSIHDYIGTLTSSQREIIDAYVEEHLNMNQDIQLLKRFMRDNNLSAEDVTQIVLSAFSSGGEDDDCTPSRQSCVPIELPEINMR